VERLGEIMSKAFVKDEGEAPEEDLHGGAPETAVPAGSKNYISPAGHARLEAEMRQLAEVERPQVVSTVSWAASNGDRSENGDYLYGKKRLREIDRRVRFLTKRLENAEIVNSEGRDTEQIFFGATVTYRSQAGPGRQITIVGLDEVDTVRGRVSWVSPIARALLKAREGDIVALRTPAGAEELEVLEVRYLPLE